MVRNFNHVKAFLLYFSPLASFWCHYLNFKQIFGLRSSVSLVNFKHVIAGSVVAVFNVQYKVFPAEYVADEYVFVSCICIFSASQSMKNLHRKLYQKL